MVVLVYFLFLYKRNIVSCFFFYKEFCSFGFLGIIDNEILVIELISE